MQLFILIVVMFFSDPKLPPEPMLYLAPSLEACEATAARIRNAAVPAPEVADVDAACAVVTKSVRS